MSSCKRSGRRTWSIVALCLLASTPLLTRAAADATRSKKNHQSSDDLFTNSIIRRIAIEISDEDMNTLRRYRWRRNSDQSDRVSVPCTVREGGRTYTNVAVHLKGSAGSFRPVDAKPALTLNFDKWADGQHFHGLDKISLNNSVQDQTYISEKLSREIFARAGVPVPRADYATVKLNDRELGPYVLTEGWDKPFLKRYFKNPKGNLYDAGQGKDINRELPVTSGENPEDQSELKALKDAAAEPDFAKRLARLEKVLDLDRFITLLALDVMLWNWDGYALNRNNFRIFHDLETKRVIFFPHGLDQMFWKADGPIMTGTKGILARAVLQTPEGRRRYLERFVQLRTNVFNVEEVLMRVDQLAARVRPALGDAGFFERIGYQRAVNTLRDRIVARASDVDEQLVASRNLLRLRTNETLSLTGWSSRARSGEPAFAETRGNAPALHTSVNEQAIGLWVTTVWLEEGRYVVEGRIRTRDIVAAKRDERGGAGLRVVSRRKISDGVVWDWFPYRNSRDPEGRAEIPDADASTKKLAGTMEWTTVTYEFQLDQPMADLEILCELRASGGEAWFDVKSLKLTRK